MSQTDLRLLNVTKSSTSIHQLYNRTHNGFPVFNIQVKVNQYRHKTVTQESIIALIPPNFNISKSFQTLESTEGYIFEDGEYKQVSSQIILTPQGQSYTLFTFENKVIHQIENNLHFKDTIVKGYVFLPDPITTSNTLYGAPLVDNNDLNAPELDDELFERDIMITWNNDSFRLENKHLIISNHSSPDIPVTVQKNNDFKFNRNQTGFEEINVIYHITKFAEYVKDTLGFDQIVNYQIPVDVYALSNADQSEFISTTSPPRLNFGQGAVDDAEDADIIIHEYTHAISHSTAPNTLAGSERRAIEEGIGDYFAAVYSKKLNINNYKDIFNWDGHNEFWSGRTIDNDYQYPDDIQGSKYSDGDLFASVLMQLRNSIPDSIADKIILESMFSWFSNMTFKDAGQLLIEADTALYSGQYSTQIISTLCDRGISIIDCTNSILKNENESLSIIINNEILRIILSTNNPYDIRIYDANGSVVINKTKLIQNEISIHNLSKGVYFLKLNNSQKVYSKKFIIIK